VLCNIVPVNFTPAFNTSTDFDRCLDQPNNQEAVVGPSTGMGNARVAASASTAGVAGAPDINAVDFYSASTDVTGSRTTNNWNWFVGVSCQGDNFTAAGVFMEIKISMRLRFYELQTPLN